MDIIKTHIKLETIPWETQTRVAGIHPSTHTHHTSEIELRTILQAEPTSKSFLRKHPLIKVHSSFWPLVTSQDSAVLCLA